MLARSEGLQRGIVLLAVVMAFANTLGNSWHYDDRHAITDNPSIRSLEQLPRLLTDPTLFSRDADKAMFRPLLLASFALNHAWSQGAVYSYRVVNLAIHAGVALLAWQLLAALGLGWRARLAGGLLVALHPLATEPVNYISARSESLTALFALASAVLHLRARDCASRPARAGSAICFGLGLLCKSVAVILPGLLLALDWSRHASLRRSWRAYVPYGLVLVAYLLAVRSFLHRAVLGEPVRSAAAQAGTQVKAAAHYLKLLAVPVDLNVHHVFHEAVWGWAVAAAVSLVLSVAYLTWRSGSGQRQLALAVLWMAIPLIPTAIVPLNILVNDHRLYLSLVGGALFAAVLQAHMRKVIHLALVGCLACLALLTVERNAEWANPHTLWTASLRQGPAPVDPVAYVHLGNDAKARGAPDQAAGYYRRALEISPDHAIVRNNLGTAYQAMGEHRRAMALYEELLSEEPNLGEARYNLAKSQQALGQLQLAIDNYLRVPATNYNYHAALNNAGTAYEGAGELDSAATYYLAAFRQRPGSGDARSNLGRLVRGLPDLAPELIESGRARQLSGLCRVLAEVAPRDPQPMYYLSVALLLQGELEGSIREGVRLVRDHGDFSEGYLHLANAYETASRLEDALAMYDLQIERLPKGELTALARQRRQSLAARMAAGGLDRDSQLRAVEEP